MNSLFLPILWNIRYFYLGTNFITNYEEQQLDRYDYYDDVDYDDKVDVAFNGDVDRKEKEKEEL